MILSKNYAIILTYASYVYYNTDKKKRKDFPIVSRTAKLRKNAAYYT